jgi:sterol desaturase/sphingolipid hydroxylase (fatty acid hydroxylase superfamily)
MSIPVTSSLMTPLAILAVFLGLLILEALRPLRRRKRRTGPRLLINLSLSALVFAVGSLVVRPVALAGAAWAAGNSFGLLHLLLLPFWAQFVAGFLLLDLTIYYWHRINHTVPLLWRFHNIHHVDPDLDVSTSFRFHFGEILYSTAFRLAQVLVVGVAPFTYVVYELAFQMATMFHHSNLCLPAYWERRLNKLVVTPRMHGIHHSAVGPETNSNYSVIFSWWDRLNRSLRLNVRQGEIVIGVPGYLNPQDNRFWPLMKFPFRKPRPYWRWPSGKASLRRLDLEKTATNFMLE